MAEPADIGGLESEFEVIDQSPRSSRPSSLEPPTLGPSDVLQQLLSILQHKWPSVDRYSPLIGGTPRNAHILIDKEVQGVTSMLSTFSEECQRVVCTLRSRRNASTALHLLAAEPPLLLTIFQLATDYGGDFRSLLHISHTCTFWRNICLETDSFHQNIDLSSLPIHIAELFADRALSPFSLSFRQSQYGTAVFPDKLSLASSFIRAHSSSIREMELSLSSIPAWLTTISSPARQLEKLDIILSPPMPFSSPLTGELFGGDTPELRELSMTGLHLQWSAQAYHGLRKLSITVAHTVTGNSVTHHEGGGVLAVLRSSPHLEEFTLQYPPFIFNQDTLLDLVPVDLPHLRHVDLNLAPSDIHNLLSGIISPQSQTLHVRVASLPYNASTGAAGSIIPADPRCLQCIGALTGLELDMRQLILRGWVPTLPGYSVEIVFDTPGVLRSTLQTICIFDLAPNLEVIRLIDSEAMRPTVLTPDDFIQALKLSSHISSLSLEGCATSILNKLTTQILHSRVPFCRNLHTLVLRDVKVEVQDILSFSRCLPGQLRKIDFLDCSFQAQDVENQLLVDLKECEIEAMSRTKPPPPPPPPSPPPTSPPEPPFSEPLPSGAPAILPSAAPSLGKKKKTKKMGGR